MQSLREDVAELMQQNRRITHGYQYTLPSPELYPFQWLWDSCFHAIILTHIDDEAAKAELRAACSQPLVSGMLPHIIYWEEPPVGATPWGRELRGDVINASWGVDGTSAITQPPIMARTLATIHKRSPDLDFVRELYPTLCRHHEYLEQSRTREPNGLVFIVNPDESGEDNSPRFDAPLGLPVEHTASENLAERIRLMQANAACNFDTRTCMTKHFAVVDIGFNVIYLESLGYMREFATLLDRSKDAIRFAARESAVRRKLSAQLSDGLEWYSYDVTNGRYITVDTWNRFLPLYGGLLSDEAADRLVHEVLCDTEQYWTPFPLPTVAKHETAYNTADDAFWRGLVWMAPNWFLYHGLRRYGYVDLAETIRQKSYALIEQSGFREQYHTVTGEGLGAHDFTWGGLVLDME